MKIFRTYSRSLLAYVCIVSGPAALADWGTFALAVHGMGLHYLTGAVLAFVAGTAVNAVLSRRVGFQSRGRSGAEEVALVYLASLLGFVVSTLTLSACIEWLHVPPLLAKIAGTGAGFVLNFAARQFYVFSAEPRWK